MSQPVEDFANNDYDSHTLFLVTEKFLYKRSALAVKTSEDKSRATTIVIAMILAFGFIGGAFGGIAIDTHFISPPQQFVGVCAPPAQITRGGCFNVITSTDASGKATTNYIPTGQVCRAMNETIAQCEQRG